MAVRRVLVVLGTRPEAIKLAPVIAALRSLRPRLVVRVCTTGQHRQMLDPLLRLFRIRPHADLDIMRPEQGLGDIAASVIDGLDAVLEREQPELVVVQGDTTSAFAAGLAACHRRIPVAHVEAGLRTGDKYFPFPEEINRRLLSTLADFHFAPTAGARLNLLAEGVPEDRIWVTGNTVIDALLAVRRRQKTEAAQRRWFGYFRRLGLDLERRGEPLLVVTGHRRENFGPGLEGICLALRDIARQRHVRIVYPVHLNPNVRRPVQAVLTGQDRIHLIEPLPYEPFVFLLGRARIVLTDSGGIQEEAPALGKPVLVMRRETERPEGVAAGAAQLVGSGRRNIVVATLRLLDDEAAWRNMARTVNPYGVGGAARRIATVLARRGRKR